MAHGRVDLVVADPQGFLRVQCKTSRLRGGVLVFHCCSNTRNERVDYRGQVDAFGVYSPALDRVYLVPVGDVGLTSGSLRVEPPANGQVTGIRWAADYLIGPP